MAYKSFQIARGNIYALSGLLMLITAITSAFLDNVTTMLLIVPVTLQIAGVLKINPIALLLPEVFASNVGGTATLIGDPPNIMIGSYAGLSFLDFAWSLGVPCLLIMAVTVLFFLLYFRKVYRAATVEVPAQCQSRPQNAFKISNLRLLSLSLIFLGITILLFIVHGRLAMAPSIAALIGATALVLTSRIDIGELLEKKIEWSTLIFFAALFVIVAAAQETGLIHLIADGVNSAAGDSLIAAVLLVLWVSALVSAVIDNIPFTATMLPVVGYLSSVVPGAHSGILWWALAMGACLGGNGTMIGASANVVTVGLAEKAGFRITFLGYMKVCLLPMVISIVICSLWLLFIPARG
jgi:Na+/H+ antiporter NhaD/arsenite permease-like protein